MQLSSKPKKSTRQKRWRYCHLSATVKYEPDLSETAEKKFVEKCSIESSLRSLPTIVIWLRCWKHVINFWFTNNSRSLIVVIFFWNRVQFRASDFFCSLSKGSGTFFLSLACHTTFDANNCSWIFSLFINRYLNNNRKEYRGQYLNWNWC